MQNEKLFEIPQENKFALTTEFLDKYRGKQPKFGPLGYVVFLRTYSRLLPDGTQEQFWQTCQRVVEGAYSILKNQIKRAHSRWSDDEAQLKAQDMYQRMFEFKFLPPGRGLYAMGTPIIEKMGGMALNNCAARSTKDIDQDFASPFCDLADWSMCGVGVGYDVRGAGKVTIQKPKISNTPYVVEDSREGWVELIRVTLNPYVGIGELHEVIDYSQIRPEGAPLKTFGGVASGYKPLDVLRCSIIELLNAHEGKPISTTVISDIFNMIGKCVVSGNIRRSSEIAMGFPDDAEFVALKDPTPKRGLRAQQDEILVRNVAYTTAKARVQELKAARKGYSVLSDEYVTLTDQIDAEEATMSSIFWSDSDILALEEKIHALPQERWRWASNNSIFAELDKPIPASIVESTVQNGEPGYMWLDVSRRYGRLVDPPTDVDQNILLPNPCGEIGLHNSELCNLSELFPTNHETLEDFLATIKVAYLYAKIVTLVPTHNEATNAVIMANRRIGLSMAGVAQMYVEKGLQECIRWWDTGYKYVNDLDKVYSGWMGIPRSIKKTTLKPGGTVPLLVGVEGGMRFPESRFYVRTIRMDHQSPLVATLRDAGYRVEPDRVVPRTVVAYFPIALPESTRVDRDVSLWEKAALFTAIQAYWSDNLVSATLTFQPHEAKDVARVLDVHTGRWKGVSFLPVSDHDYAQPPYAAITKEEYEELASRLKPLSEVFGKVHDKEDKFCDGDRCVIG